MGAAALLLSFGTICGGIAAACVAIAFATDNWLEYSVDRNSIMKIITNVENAKSPEYADVVSDVNRTKIYFDRTVGLWRQCFPTLIPNGKTFVGLCHLLLQTLNHLLLKYLGFLTQNKSKQHEFSNPVLNL